MSYMKQLRGEPTGWCLVCDEALYGEQKFCSQAHIDDYILGLAQMDEHTLVDIKASIASLMTAGWSREDSTVAALNRFKNPHLQLNRKVIHEYLMKGELQYEFY